MQKDQSNSDTKNIIQFRGMPIECDFGPKLPLVSLVIINWNYSNYISETIRSVRDQDYPDVEILIIDNGSTDDSLKVIHSAVEDDPRVTILELDKNYGQLGAALIALNHIKGSFISFVDADDYIFRNYVSTHIRAHFSTPASVSFTSSSVLEINEDGNLISFKNLMTRSRLRNTPKPLANQTEGKNLDILNDSSVSEAPGLDDIQMIAASNFGWFWGPGTANMYRAALLNFLRPTIDNKPLLQAADAYFNPACHSVAGSTIIGTPLSAYRIHGKNYYSVLETIGGLAKTTEAVKKKQNQAMIDNAKSILARNDDLSWTLKTNFFNLIDHILRANPRTPRGRRIYKQTQIVIYFCKYSKELFNKFGIFRFLKILYERFTIPNLIRIVWSAIK